MTTWLTNPAHARWLEAETDALLDFACASRTSTGFGRLDADGVLEPGIPDELWITCRMTHVFSLGALMGRPGCAPLVDHGLASLQNHFEDREYGGWYSAITSDCPANDIKEAYAHAFVLLAASSALVAKRPGAWTHELDASNRPSGRTWPGKPDAYHAVQTTLMPRLPLALSFAAALPAGKLDG